MTWLQEHLEEKIAQWAAEDDCAPEEWRERALYYVARSRYQSEAAYDLPTTHCDCLRGYERVSTPAGYTWIPCSKCTPISWRAN